MPIAKDRVSYTLNLDDLLEDVPEDDREDAAFDAGEAALEKVVDYMDRQVSPVSGKGKFPALGKQTPGEKAYRKLKQRKVGNQKGNLRLTGDLINSLDVDADDRSFTISVDSDNAGKAHNHLTGTTVRPRPFLPDDTSSGKNRNFKRDIISAIKQSIDSYKEKPKARPKDVAPEEVTASEFDKLYDQFKATKREKAIAKTVTLFKIEDIL